MKGAVFGVRAGLNRYKLDLKQPWQTALLLIAVIPLFPEYLCFPLVIAAGIFAWRDLKQHNRPLRLDKIGKLLLIFIAYMALSVFYSRNRLNSLATTGMWVVLFAIYLIGNNLLTDTGRFNILMLWIAAVSGIVGFIACCQYRIGFFTHGNPIQVWSWLDALVYRIIPIRLCHTPYVLRACSTYSNPNMLSEYLTMVAPFVIYINFHERRQDIRLFCRLCLFLTFAGIIFSFSRGGYLALLALLLALLVLNIRHRFAATTMYVFSGLLLIPEEVVERFLTIFPGISSGGKIIEGVTGAPTLSYTTTAEIINNAPAEMAMDSRWRIWLESLHSFTQHPIFGTGAGIQNTWDMLRENGIDAVHAHNVALELLVEGGVIALILMLLIGFMVVKNGVELIRAGYSTAFWAGFAVLGFASSFILQGTVDYPLMTPKLVCNFMMLAGITERVIHLYSGKEIAVRRTLRKRLQRQRNPVTG